MLTEPVSARKVKRPIMTLAQVAAGLKYTRGLKSKRDYLILRLATTRGLRPSELFALRVNDLQGNSLMIDEGVVQYRVGDTKSESSKAPVVLTVDLRKELEAYIQMRGLSGDDFLFAYSTGIPMSQNNYVRRQMKTIGKKIGVPGMDFRMLRRTFATHFKKHGDPKDLQSAMRHADVTMSLEVYQQEIPEETFRAVASYEDEIMSLVEAA